MMGWTPPLLSIHPSGMVSIVIGTRNVLPSPDSYRHRQLGLDAGTLNFCVFPTVGRDRERAVLWPLLLTASDPV